MTGDAQLLSANAKESKYHFPNRTQGRKEKGS
jgi:hypothetical protein